MSQDLSKCESGCRSGWVHFAAHSEPCAGCNSDASRPYPAHGHPGWDVSAGDIERAVWGTEAENVQDAFRSALIERARDICHETGTDEGSDAFCAETIRDWLIGDPPIAGIRNSQPEPPQDGILGVDTFTALCVQFDGETAHSVEAFLAQRQAPKIGAGS